MGWAKTDEDIREAIDERYKNNGQVYYADTHINSYPSYPSKKVSSSGVYVDASSRVTKPLVDLSRIPSKHKIGTVVRNYERQGIEIYFSRKPSMEIRNKLKIERWFWHQSKRCWYNRYSVHNMDFAERIVAL